MAGMSSLACYSVSSRRTTHGSLNLARSTQPIVDRGSIFTAQLCYPVESVAAANAAVALMRAEGPASCADHNMSAFRICGAGKKVDKAYDDDGEAHGGQRLLGCLTRLKVTNAAVMVSRVYGGQNLGKARFEHICRAAEGLLHAVGHEPGSGVRHQWGSGVTLGGGVTSGAEGEGADGSLASSLSAGAHEAPAASKKRARPKSAAVDAAVDAAERRRLLAAAAEHRAAAGAVGTSAQHGIR